MTEELPPLKGAQERIRDAFFEHEQGLFVLGCTAGFGKSMTGDRVGAEALVRNAASSPAPEEGLCIVSFSRDDAASIVPGITAALAGFADDDCETATTIDEEQATWLQERAREAEHIGTIDSIFHSVFDEIHAEYGFDDMPTVGTDALLTSLRNDALEAMRRRADFAAAFERLDAAYPTASDDDESRLDEMLEVARSEKRARRLSDEQFRDRLSAVVDDAYPSGRPESFDEVVSDVAQLFDRDTAATFEQGHDDEREVLERSRACLDAWPTCVDEFSSLVSAYEREYDRLCRERGVLDHQDVAYWVADFFDTRSDAGTAERGDGDDDIAARARFRERVRQRHARALQTLIVDEAQDVSVAQHDALAPLVPDDARILLAGDINQCIYAWRDARPALFARAFEQGEYFGRLWDPHESVAASRTYRMRPDISATVDAVFDDVFTDPTRGAMQGFGGDYSFVETDRDESSGPSVHIAAYRVDGLPGNESWFEEGEREPLANYIHGALSRDAFATADSDDPMTVLFPTRTNMQSLANTLEAKGLSVADASERLFETALVELIGSVVEWLVDPFDPERTRELVDEIDDQIGHDTEPSIGDVFEECGYRFEDGRRDERLSRTARTLLDGLSDLRRRLARRTADPGVLVVEDVIETLALEGDPLDQVADRRRCLAILDTLLETVDDWEQTDRYCIAELAAVLDRYRTAPSDGPVVPVPDASEYDVVFRTIHNAKGDEADIVCLADLSNPLGAMGPQNRSFVGQGETLALAPPATAPPVAVDPQSNGPGQSPPRLRWVTNRWVDDDPPRIGGPPLLGDVARAHRADDWRTLYVAMTRAREHLILSLPRNSSSVGTVPQDSWVSTIRETLGLPDSLSHGPIDTTLRRPDGEYDLTIGCLDVPFDPPRVDSESGATPPVVPDRSTDRTSRTPRFVNGSTLHPLATDTDEHWLAHLKGTALHSDRPAPDGDFPIAFDAIGPGELGTIAHDVLTTAVDRGVSTETLERCAGPLSATLDSTIDARSGRITPRERAQVASYVCETVCPQFAATDVWERLQASEAVYVEEPLDDVIAVAGHTIETRNHADIVSRTPNGTWHVDDIKLVLATHDADTRDRYALQTAFYVWLLERQLSDEPVQGHVTYLGEHVESTVAEPPIDSIHSWLTRLAR